MTVAALDTRPAALPTVANDRGAALALALVMLLLVTSLALALLTMSGLEPQISRNHADLVRARYLAEGGLERAFDRLAGTVGSWDTSLAGATCTTGAVLPDADIPGGASTGGSVVVRVRNDCSPGDERLTGAAAEASTSAEQDTNGTVIVASTGVVDGAQHTVRAVISYNGPMTMSGQSVSRSLVTLRNWADH